MTTARTSNRHISELESHLGFWLRLVSNHVSAEFQRRVEERGVSVSEWVALRQLHGAGAVAQGDLGQALGLTKGALSKIAARLEEAGLVARRPAPSDARSWLLTLTAAGRRLVPELARIADANDEDFFGHLAPEERARLIADLRRVAILKGLSGPPTE